MKKTLKLALGALMMAGAVNAQVATLPNGYYDYEWGVLPKLFSSDGKGKLVATEYSGEGSNIKVNVYNSSFNVEHSFEIVPHITTSKTVTERRAYEAVPGELLTGDVTIFGEEFVNDYWNNSNINEKINLVSTSSNKARLFGRDFDTYCDRDSVYTDDKGDIYCYLFGEVYINGSYDESIIGYYIISGTTVKYQFIDNKRTGEWEVVEVDEYTGENYMSAMWNMMNIDDDWSYELGEPLIVTQTLFNADAKYEYLRDKRVSYSDRITYENDNDGDGIVDYRTISSGYDFAGYEVVSEDGNVIASFDVDDVDGKYLILWGGKRYLGFNVYGDNNGYSFLIYEINSNGSGITRASSEAFMHILPAMPRKNTTVTVELGEESAKNGGQLMITDMKGRTVYTTPVAPNETSVQVPLRRMASGVYSVTLMNRGQKIENSKLIIR